MAMTLSNLGRAARRFCGALAWRRSADIELRRRRDAGDLRETPRLPQPDLGKLCQGVVEGNSPDAAPSRRLPGGAALEPYALRPIRFPGGAGNSLRSGEQPFFAAIGTVGGADYAGTRTLGLAEAPALSAP